MFSLAVIALVGLLGACHAQPSSYSPSSGGYSPPSGGYSPPSGGYSSNSNSGYNNQQPSYAPSNSYNQPPSYGGHARPSGYGPVRTSYVGGGYGPSYGHGYGYGGYQDNRYAEDQLDRADSFLDNLESRETNQISRLGRLIQSANSNLDFKNTFDSAFYPEILDRQKVQASRLNDLQDTINRIKALRTTVQELQNQAENTRNYIENVIYPTRKQIMYDISDLQNMDIERSNRIAEANGRADAINERIDAVSIMAADNFRDLNVIKNKVRSTILSVNRQRGAVANPSVDPNGQNAPPTATVDFTPPFDGVPQASPSLITGFHVVRNHYYSGGYPSIYFGIGDDVWNNRAEFDSRDSSSGGFNTESINFNAAFGYFDTRTLNFK
ncbi:uncharacterized protein LOC101846794 [Aplysia californica]|uniref:Uncharacterized protein LOC101846794 n=1 Tax=Aplysia californica TaxID=6500 RepID=A0ABM0JER3_APLCA|nr:uncharacterized protein LOC101846794 [Aplysia californica]